MLKNRKRYLSKQYNYGKYFNFLLFVYLCLLNYVMNTNCFCNKKIIEVIKISVTDNPQSKHSKPYTHLRNASCLGHLLMACSCLREHAFFVVTAVVMINIRGGGPGEARCFDCKHDCSGENGYGHAGGSGDDCPSDPCKDVVMAVRMMTVGLMVVGVRSLSVTSWNVHKGDSHEAADCEGASSNDDDCGGDVRGCWL